MCDVLLRQSRQQCIATKVFSVCKGLCSPYIHATPQKKTKVPGESLSFRSRKMLVGSCYSPPRVIT